jgi:hypothetical protein
MLVHSTHFEYIAGVHSGMTPGDILFGRADGLLTVKKYSVERTMFTLIQSISINVYTHLRCTLVLPDTEYPKLVLRYPRA